MPLLSAALLAHDLYILPNIFRVKPGMRLQIAFHNGDAFPESEVAPALVRLLEAQIRSAHTTVPVHGLKADGKRVIGFADIPAAGGDLLLSVHTKPNFIELPADKFRDYLQEEGLAAVISWRESHGEALKPGRERYSKFAKSLLVSGEPDKFYSQPLGFVIEIIPEENPSALHAGKQLPVRVVFHGKPGVGLQLEAAWSANGQHKTEIAGRTDSEGRIRVPIRKAGMWRLHTLAMERCAEPAAADWESSWASLTFEIPN